MKWLEATRNYVQAALFASAMMMSGSSSVARAQPHALEVPGYHAAACVLPEGDGPRPVVIALHGNFDRPEWMCAAWARVVAGRAFLLCPRGEPRTDAPGQDRWSLPVAAVLAREVAAARAALAERYPGRVDDGPDVWVGFSQGAHRLSRMASGAPEQFPRIQLVEGGAAMWRHRGATSYARSHGRVALVCAMGWCEQQGQRLRTTLRARGVEAQLERIPTAHHDLDTMRPAIQRTFDWLVASDSRFAAGG